MREYLGDVIDSGVKFLLFAHHTLMLDGVEDLVRSKVWVCVCLSLESMKIIIQIYGIPHISGHGL